MSIVNDYNLVNLMPLLITAVLVTGLTIWLIWPPKPPTKKPPILDSATVLLQAKNYSGEGDWLDESGNGHDATLSDSQIGVVNVALTDKQIAETSHLVDDGVEIQEAMDTAVGETDDVLPT